MKMFRQARTKENWAGAKVALEQLRENLPGDPFILQQLALATYKGKLPDPKKALADAQAILQELQPQTSNDPETLGIWGAIHKRKWELDGQRRGFLEESIRSYGKGFNLKDDYYNGINYAFMLNVARAAAPGPDQSRTSCGPSECAVVSSSWAKPGSQQGVKDDQGNVDLEQQFWLRATLIEALFGIGDSAGAESKKKQAVDEAPESWMPGSLEEQLGKLRKILAKAPK